MTNNVEGNSLRVLKIMTPPPFDFSRETISEDGNKVTFPAVPGTSVSIEPILSCPHDSEVHRARFMPQCSHVVATRSANQSVDVFDLSKAVQSMNSLQNGDGDDSTTHVQHDAHVMTLHGPERMGWGLEWND